jgi:hypothetical protein
MRRLLLLLLLIPSILSAGDKTPYKFIFGGNSYSGPRNASVTWLAERYDVGIAGLVDWPGLHDSIYDTALVMGKDYWCGPYASSQEINLYERLNPGKQYNDRLKNITDHWLYVYAKRYLDSIGVSVESLVVHISDNFISMGQDGDGLREYTLTGLPYHKKRFTYQYWNNTSLDTMFYPAGYAWLANGYNPNARQAIAYAYRRHFIEDSVTYGPGDHHWSAYFMDNQYRGGFMPRLSSYYALFTTTGGPTSGLDWTEQSGIGNNLNSNLTYYDRSTMLIDSTVRAVLDSACNAKGLDRIVGFANVDKFSPEHLSVQLRYTNVNLENPVDYTKSWPDGWQKWYAMADTMAHHPERYICWLFLGDFLCSATPSDWRYDSSRIYLAHYAFFLQVQDTNAFCGPARFNDTTRWRGIYEVNFGRPTGPAYEVSSTGSNSTKIAVMRRDYDNGAIAVLLRTSHSSADWVRDSVAVNMHHLCRQIDVHGDTSVTADSIFYLKPYTGKVLITTDSCGMPPSAPKPSSPASGTAVTTRPTLCATNSTQGTCTDPVTYQFIIAEDPGFSSIVRQSGWITQGVGTTCYAISTALNDGRRYFWRCRATNGTTTSGWSSAFYFTTPNSPPPTPTGSSPPNQGTVDVLQPTLVVNGVVDPNGTPLIYFFQVSPSASFSPLTAQSGQVSAGGGLVSWRVTPPLEDGATYYWRARAYDSIAYSGWMSAMSFTIDASLAETYLRGDINVNGIPNEVADGVMYSSFFISGLSAFGNHVAGSIAASDVNDDSVTLSLADFAFLVRVITGEALPYPKIASSAHKAFVDLRMNASAAVISADSPVDIGAAYFVLKHSGYVIDPPRLGSRVSDMSLIYSDVDGELKILISSFRKGAVMASGETDLVVSPLAGSGSIQLTTAELVEYFGDPIDVTLRNAALPLAFALYQNHPNPFNPTTVVSFSLPSPTAVLLEVYNISGQKVTTLFDGSLGTGTHDVQWDGRADDGTIAASGIYFYRLKAGDFTETKKMILLK